MAPKFFWRNAEQFAERGIGYTLMDGGEAASTAFAAFVEDSQLEIGIETNEQHRGKGYASHVCAALIDYCLENGLEPVWSCRKKKEGRSNSALCPLQRFNIQLVHLKHRVHDSSRFFAILILQEFSQDSGHDLPRQTELVLKPAASLLLSAFRKLIP